MNRAVASSGLEWDGGLLAQAAEDGLGAGWLIGGLLAQAMVAACLLVFWLLSRRAGRAVLPKAAVYAAMAATVFLGIHAFVGGQWVFLVGQATWLAACIVLAAYSERQEEQPIELPDEGRQLPVVAPDSAERKLTRAGAGIPDGPNPAGRPSINTIRGPTD